MKITKLRVYAVELPLDKPYRLSGSAQVTDAPRLGLEPQFEVLGEPLAIYYQKQLGPRS